MVKLLANGQVGGFPSWLQLRAVIKGPMGSEGNYTLFSLSPTSNKNY